MAEAFGLKDPETISAWRDRYPEFARAIREGSRRPIKDVEAAALKRALGLKVRETRFRVTTVREGGKDVERAKPFMVVEREIPPSQRSIEFYLTNRTNRWKRKISVDVNRNLTLSNERDPEKLKVIEANMRDLELQLSGGSGKNGGNGHHHHPHA